jgi:hypothetical protein
MRKGFPSKSQMYSYARRRAFREFRKETRNYESNNRSSDAPNKFSKDRSSNIKSPLIVLAIIVAWILLFVFLGQSHEYAGDPAVVNWFGWLLLSPLLVGAIILAFFLGPIGIIGLVLLVVLAIITK